MPFAPTPKPKLLVRQVGDHFVGVHVGRGAGAGLIDVDREVIVVLAGGHFFDAAMIASASFSSSLPSSRLACAQAAFRWPNAWITRGRHRLVGDGKIFDGPRGRRAVQRVGRHLHLAHRVAFGAELAHGTHNPQLARDKIAAMILTTAAERNGESRRFSARASRSAAVNDSVLRRRCVKMVRMSGAAWCRNPDRVAEIAT